MPSSERGWYLVWDKLLLQTKLPLPSLLKSPLVLARLMLWGVISNLGRERRWWEGVGRGVEMNSVSCPQHITYCLETLPGRDCMNLLVKADLVKLNISGSSLPRGEPKNTCRAALNYWGIKNLLKAVRIVHAGKGSSDFRNSCKLRVSYSNRICYIPCWTFRLKRCRRGPRVPVCMCVSGYKSVDQLLQHRCVHFLVAHLVNVAKAWGGVGKAQTSKPALSFTMHATLSELWFSPARNEDICTFLAELWGIKELMYPSPTRAFQHANNVSFLNPPLRAPKYSQ